LTARHRGRALPSTQPARAYAQKKPEKARGTYRPCALTGLEAPSASGTAIPSRVIAFCDAHGFIPAPETAQAQNFGYWVLALPVPC